MRWIGTSWKMNRTLAEAREYASGLAAALEENTRLSTAGAGEGGVQPFVIPPHTALAAVAQEFGEKANSEGGVQLGAQNAHWEDAGAWTGEISVPQAMDAGATMIEIGHSERREHFAETDRTVRLKVEAALRHGAMPLLCVGEPAEVRDAGGSAEHILAQTRAALAGLTDSQCARALVAYEPIWAIGASGRPAEIHELEEPFAALRAEFGTSAELGGSADAGAGSVAGGVAGLLYGGSVNLDNAEDLLAMQDVDGLFVGRTAWDLKGFLKLLEIASV